MNDATRKLGVIESLFRYPVKSMQGERLQAATLGESGLTGDRAWALIDPTTGAVVSAKNPRKWPHLFDYAAAYDEGSGDVVVTLPDGTTVSSADAASDNALSLALGRAVQLRNVPPPNPTLQQFWPDAPGEAVTEERLPANSFFDLGIVHLLTTATLAELGRVCPESDCDVRRFRPNIVVRTDAEFRGFVEQSWLGKTLLLGDTVRLRVTAATGRCVMTTLSQPGLAADARILRSAAHYAGGNIGVYAVVEQGGVLRHGDEMYFDESDH